jgi:hypothetical protein
LRNKEIKTAKPDSIYRILCLGDSWTFGWGVNVEESWPMQLETFLKNKEYKHIEIINCGRPGQYTTTHKKYLAELIPKLQPDLILLGVLQLDDLAQLYEHTYFSKNNQKETPEKSGSFESVKKLLSTFVFNSFSQYIRIFKPKNIKPHANEAIDIKKEWAQTSEKLIQQFNSLQQLRFSTFPDTVKTLFKSGNLNAALLDIYINYPDRLTIFNNPTNPATIYAFKQMNKDVEEMKQLCDNNKVKLIFLNLPMNDFVGHQVTRMSSDILTAFWVQENKIDSMYHSIAKKNNLPYLELTKSFIQLKDKNAYFFQFDGHPNKFGYKFVSETIGNYLIESDFNKK